MCVRNWYFDGPYLICFLLGFQLQLIARRRENYDIFKMRNEIGLQFLSVTISGTPVWKSTFTESPNHNRARCVFNLAITTDTGELSTWRRDRMICRYVIESLRREKGGGNTARCTNWFFHTDRINCYNNNPCRHHQGASINLVVTRHFYQHPIRFTSESVSIPRTFQQILTMPEYEKFCATSITPESVKFYSTCVILHKHTRALINWFV